MGVLFICFATGFESVVIVALIKVQKNEPQGDCEQDITKAEVGFDEVNTATSRFLSIQLFDKLEFIS